MSCVGTPEYTFLPVGFNILSSEHCCFLSTCYHHWWGSLFLWKTAQHRLKLQGSSGYSPRLPRTRLEGWRLSAQPPMSAQSSSTAHSKCQDTGKALNLMNLTQVQMPGRWGSAPLDLHIQISFVRCRRKLLLGRRGPGAKRNWVGRARS